MSRKSIRISFLVLALAGAGLTVTSAHAACSSDATHLCLTGSRFSISAQWTNYNTGVTAAANAVPFRDESGFFYFQDPNKVEIMVQIKDACPGFGHFWVFAAATTNVAYTLTVVDTQTGRTENYSNPAHVLSAAITDQSSFSCQASSANGLCYVDTTCTAGNKFYARDSGSGQCVDTRTSCTELWKCPSGPTLRSCGGGAQDCTFSPGCSEAVQDCFYGGCTNIGICNDRIKFQGYSFTPTANQCSCQGGPPAAGPSCQSSSASGAYYSFDEGSGTVAHDSSGAGNDATVEGASWTNGYSGSALHFGALPTTAVLLPQSIFSGFGNSFSISAWVRPSDRSSCYGARTIFRKRVNNGWGIEAFMGGEGSGFACSIHKPGGGGLGVTGGNIPLDQWTKVTCNYDGAALYATVGGQQIGSKAGAFSLDWELGQIRTEIGNDTYDINGPCGDYSFHGDIDEVEVSPSATP